MVKKYDVIIVGAGQAGAFSALLLARGGKKVLLLEKSSFPRLKVCGHCLHPGVGTLLEKHGLLSSFQNLPFHRLEGVRVNRDEETLFRRNLEGLKYPMLAVDRQMMDAWMVERAMESGVEFIHETRVQTVHYSGKVETSAGDFEADWIIGADGRNSIVARSAGLSPDYQESNRVGWQAQMDVEGLDDDLHIRLFPEGYMVYSHLNSKSANLWMVLDSKVAGVPQKITNRYFPKLPALVWHSFTPPSGKSAVLGKESIWLVGDAAYTPPLFTTEGIYFGLLSAELAAQAILWVQRREDRALGLLRYQREHRLLCSTHFKTSGWMRWFLSHSRYLYRYSRWFRYFPGTLSQIMNRILGNS